MAVQLPSGGNVQVLPVPHCELAEHPQKPPTQLLFGQSEFWVHGFCPQLPLDAPVQDSDEPQSPATVQALAGQAPAQEPLPHWVPVVHSQRLL